MNKNIAIYADGEIELKVSFEEDTIWLTQKQIAELFEVTKQLKLDYQKYQRQYKNIELKTKKEFHDRFLIIDRDIKTIGKHINNVFKDGELEKFSVVAKFATTALDGKTYNIEHYNLDVIISVGYRVKSQRGVSFRQWATTVLKNYISSGYAINSDKITHERFVSLEKEVSLMRCEIKDIKSKVKDDILEYKQGIFYNGQIYDAYAFINDLLKHAKKEIVLIDYYVDDTIFTLCSKYPNIRFTIYTQSINKQLKQDYDKYQKQYKNIELKEIKNFHDRFLIIDDSEIYHIGASIKDLGNKVFAFSKLNVDLFEMIGKLS